MKSVKIPRYHTTKKKGVQLVIRKVFRLTWDLFLIIIKTYFSENHLILQGDLNGIENKTKRIPYDFIVHRDLVGAVGLQ